MTKILPSVWRLLTVFILVSGHLNSLPYLLKSSQIWTNTIHCPLLYLKNARWVANSVDPDETPHFAAYHQGLHFLPWPVCPNTYDNYGNCFKGSKQGCGII